VSAATLHPSGSSSNGALLWRTAAALQALQRRLRI
jgi:hypothetical protein